MWERLAKGGVYMEKKKNIFLYITDCGRVSESAGAKKLAEAAFQRLYGRSATLTHHGNGKPYFEGEDGIFVSLSHGDGICVAAISDGEVGVDTELMKGGDERLLSIAKRYFAPDEAEYAGIEPIPRFYEIWCKKESYVKFTGKGISSGLSNFSVLSRYGISENIRFFHTIYGDRMLALCSEAEFCGEPEYIKIN